MKRGFNAWQTHCSMYPSIFNRFPVIQPLSSKVRHYSTFLHIFASLGYAPGTITVKNGTECHVLCCVRCWTWLRLPRWCPGCVRSTPTASGATTIATSDSISAVGDIPYDMDRVRTVNRLFIDHYIQLVFFLIVLEYFIWQDVVQDFVLVSSYCWSVCDYCSREYSDHPPLWLRLRFCDSVCPHDKTKTVETKIAKLGTEIVHHDT